MRLRRSVVSRPGLVRRRRGKGFSYHEPGGGPVTDAETLARIRDLVIPPAWRQVWICPYPNGHIQAVGTDAAGRRQYLYHAQWQRERSEEKFDRVLGMSPGLPEVRRRIAADLAGDGLSRDRVLALALLLLDRGYFRAGGETYANKEDDENNSYGVATLRCEHVTVRGGSGAAAVVFDFPAKHGVQRTWEIDDPAVAMLVDELLAGHPDGGRLLVYPNGSGWNEIRAADLNTRFKELVGEEYSVKDMRTWHATVLAAQAFVTADLPVNKTVRKRVEAAVMREVCEELGNTAAVARSSYVDPRVVRAYEKGMTIAAAARRAARTRDRDTAQGIVEKATVSLIRRVR